MLKYLIVAAPMMIIADSALALECGPGTITASFYQFHSSTFAGRLAIARRATSSEEAKGSRTFCVLIDQTAHITRRFDRTDRIYFVFNNMVTSGPEYAETAFTGLEVRVPSLQPGLWVNMRRNGESWEPRPLDDRYPRREVAVRGREARVIAQVHRPFQFAALPPMRTDASDPTAIPNSEEAFAERYGASVHGAVRPKPGAELRRTWDVRDRFDLLGGVFGADETPGQTIEAVWTSFDQRTTPPSYRRDWAKRVANEVRVGRVPQIDVHLFGSNGEIPELRYNIIFD